MNDMPKVELATGKVFHWQLNTIYRYFRITHDTFSVGFIPKSIFRIFKIAFNLFYIRISAISKRIYSITVFIRAQRTFGNPLRTFRQFFLLRRKFPPYTRGLLGCLLGFWPSGPKLAEEITVPAGHTLAYWQGTASKKHQLLVKTLNQTTEVSCTWQHDTTRHFCKSGMSYSNPACFSEFNSNTWPLLKKTPRNTQGFKSSHST